MSDRKETTTSTKPAVGMVIEHGMHGYSYRLVRYENDTRSLNYGYWECIQESGPPDEVGSTSLISATLIKEAAYNLINDSNNEATTLEEAKELATTVLQRLGLTVGEWRESKNSTTSWEYTDVDVGAEVKMVVGISSGGVVSIDGRPHTPDGKVNVTRERVEQSMGDRIRLLRLRHAKDDSPSPGM